MCVSLVRIYRCMVDVLTIDPILGFGVIQSDWMTKRRQIHNVTMLCLYVFNILSLQALLIGLIFGRIGTMNLTHVTSPRPLGTTCGHCSPLCGTITLSGSRNSMGTGLGKRILSGWQRWSQHAKVSLFVDLGSDMIGLYRGNRRKAHWSGSTAMILGRVCESVQTWRCPMKIYEHLWHLNLVSWVSVVTGHPWVWTICIVTKKTMGCRGWVLDGGKDVHVQIIEVFFLPKHQPFIVT